MKIHHILAAPLLSVILASSPVFAADAVDQNKELETLRKQISDLVKKVETLETKSKQQAAQPAPAPAADAASKDQFVSKGKFPGSILIPGTDTSMKINGLVKLDVITDLGGAYADEYNKYAQIPLDGSAKSGLPMETRFHARQSKLAVETRTPTEYGEMKTLIEGDFYGATAASRLITNGDGFQVRHAFGSLGHVLAGQTWSTFMDTDCLFETMDYGGPSALIFIRQGQVRYTDTFGKWTVSGSIENPQGDFFTTDSTRQKPNAEMPDIVARADYKYGLGYTSLRALVRQINAVSYSGAINAILGPGYITQSGAYNKDTEFGYAFAVSGKQKFYEGANDTFNYQFVYGDGVGRYLYEIGLPNTGNSYINGRLELQKAYAGFLGMQHVWSPHWRTNLFGGFTHVSNNDAMKIVADTNQTINKFVGSGHINLVWQPIPSFKVGTEYTHAYRKYRDGKEGNLDRLETSFIYNF